MTSPELENLVRVGQLKRAAHDSAEIDGLVRSGIARLTDAVGAPAVNADGRYGHWSFTMARKMADIIDVATEPATV